MQYAIIIKLYAEMLDFRVDIHFSGHLKIADFGMARVHDI